MTRRLAFLTIALLTSLSLPGTPQLQESSTYAQAEGILILNEISPWPSDGVVWVELLNPSDQTVPLAGWSVQFLSGYSYAFPEDSPEIVPGGLHLLNIGGGNPLDPNGDGCILVGPDGPVDAITWGEVEIVTGIGLRHGPPLKPEYEFFLKDENLYKPDDVCLRIPDTWPPDIETHVGSWNWAYRDSSEATPGQANNSPGPSAMLPEDGAVMASDFTLGVSGLEWASQATFAVEKDAPGGEVALEETTEDFNLPVVDLPAGTYFWRVRGESPDAGITGPWSAYRQFTIEPFDIDELIATAEGQASGESGVQGVRLARHKGGGGPSLGQHRVLGLSHLVQRRDTDMLCLDGCNMHDEFPWDSQHPLGDMHGGHNRYYCARASLAMIASQGGNSLSQDRISYYIFEEVGAGGDSAPATGHLNDPYCDLGHGRGANQDDICVALDWIYGQPKGSSKWWMFDVNLFDKPGAPMDSIKEFIDDGRPVVRGTTRHATVIDGYALISTNSGPPTPYVRVLDPWFSGPRAVVWGKVQQGLAAAIMFPPTTGRPSRSDEPELSRDSDADGINDFDEIRRLHTDPNNPDSDVDGVHDKEDMLGYLFNPDGWYIPLPRDYDNDGAAKELDPDNDDPNDRSSRDGCEDANGNGFLDANGRETFNFDLADDFDYVNPDCLRGFIRWEVIATRHDAEIDLDYHYLEEVRLEPGDISGDEYVHPHHYEHSMNSVDINGSTMTGYDTKDAEVRAKLEYEEGTGEYFLTIDSNMPPSDFEVTVVAFGFVRVIKTPFEYEFDNDGRWNLGVPKEVNGGLLCEGEWETVSGLNVQGPTKLTWMVWITPPQ